MTAAHPPTLSSNELEAANRAEATALLIRRGYRVYRPEADVEGEDLVLRSPERRLLLVQLKGRLTVNDASYGGDRTILMLFPDRPFDGAKRDWFLVPHGDLLTIMRKRHGHTENWKDAWTIRTVPKQVRPLLEKFQIL